MLSFFPVDVLEEIWDVIESISEGFLSYSYHVQCTETGNFRIFDFEVKKLHVK